MTTIKSKFRIFKVGVNLILLTTLIIVLSQNAQKVDVDLLFWQVHVPLVILLLGVALFSALIVFITILMVGRN
ncbi:MAG: LapA family protein [Bacteroidota bacterium]